MIPLKFKEGVKFSGVQPEIHIIILPVLICYMDLGAPYCMITSALDGTHSTNSLHYKGLALDFRTRHMPEEALEPLVKRIRQCIGDQYDVVLEKTHIHIEYDPKD